MDVSVARTELSLSNQRSMRAASSSDPVIARRVSRFTSSRTTQFLSHSLCVAPRDVAVSPVVAASIHSWMKSHIAAERAGR